MGIFFNIFANLISAVAVVSGMVLQIFMIVLFVRAVISWFSPDPFNPLVQFLYKVTEPVLIPIRRIVPMYNIGIDLSVWIAFLAIVFLQQFLVVSMHQLAAYLRSYA